MTPTFSFAIDSIKTVSELPGTWTPQDCLKLLAELEYEGASDLPEAELRDYATMSLQDRDCAEAALALLNVVIGDRLSAGKKQNVSEEMQSERLWEEYPDLSCHEPIFNAQVLLNQAFDSIPKPEARLIQATLRPVDQASEAHLRELAKPNPPEAFIARCIAAASSETSILNRLFEDQIAGQPFPEAEYLVWQVQSKQLPAEGSLRPGLALTLFSPVRWTESLKQGTVIECSPANKITSSKS